MSAKGIRGMVRGRPERGKRRARPAATRRPRYLARPRAWRDWPVSRRLMAVAVIAIAAGLTLGSLRLAAAADSSATFSRVTQLAVLGQRVTGLAQALEDERDQTAGFIAAGRPAQDLGIVVNAQSGTHEAAVQVTDAAGRIGPGLPVATRAKVTTVLARIDDLPGLRQAAVYTQLPSLPVIMDYSAVIADLFSLNDEIAQGSADRAVTDNVRALGDLSRLEEASSRQRALLFAALTEHHFEPRALAALISAQSAEAGYLQAFQTTATPQLQQAYNDTVASSQVDEAQLIEQRVIATGAPQTDGLGLPAGNPARQWYAAMTGTLSPVRAIEGQLTGVIVAQSRALQAGPWRAALLTTGFTAAFLIFVLGVTLLVARSIVLPLRRLKTAALEIASVGLSDRVSALTKGSDAVANPDVHPISGYSADEIGQVARAFDQVYAEALRLAGHEAILRRNVSAMFVSLSYRSQSGIDQLANVVAVLAGRQPAYTLHADLAAMDRILARMRRDCQLLLVLARYETVSQQDSRPVSLIKIAHAAVSGIDLGYRLSVNIPPGLGVASYAAADVIHVLAELIENAANFSPPTAPVTLSAGEPPGGGLHIDITDSGPGLPQDRLDELNGRLADPPLADPGISRQMGLLAVAHLAARHGALVRLLSSGTSPTAAGTVAQVWLPAAITVASAADEPGHPDWQITTGAQHLLPGDGDSAAAPSALAPPGDTAAKLPARAPRTRGIGRHAAPQGAEEP
jgi:signal transduction histidine kinase